MAAGGLASRKVRGSIGVVMSLIAALHTEEDDDLERKDDGLSANEKHETIHHALLLEEIEQWRMARVRNSTGANRSRVPSLDEWLKIARC